jgi:O-acetyl-ADP-ribose deacetylase (regulator of RNase III)
MSAAVRLVAGRRMEAVRGDITLERVDAIVNAANEGLRGGGGVDGAIHRAGGPEIMAQCRAIGRCATGDAVVTGAGRLAAEFVFHAVGPIYRDGRSGEPELLRGCYRRCMELALERGLESIAFPAISCGVYGYPIVDAAGIAVDAVAEALAGSTSVRLARFVLFPESHQAVYAERLAGAGER